jgi:hypothetical protein
MNTDIDNEINLKMMEIRIEKDSKKRELLNKQLRKLQLQKEIEIIKLKIDQLS